MKTKANGWWRPTVRQPARKCSGLLRRNSYVQSKLWMISWAMIIPKKSNAKPLKSFVVTSPYGKRELNGKTELHKGIDLASDEGSEIFAVFDGEAVTAEADASYGNYIVLKHTDGAETLYAHCNRLLIKKGDKVKAGQPIAVIGSTGDADGTHLHFELHKNGSPVDPTPLIGNDP